MSDVDRTQKAMNIGVFSLAIKELWKIFFLWPLFLGLLTLMVTSKCFGDPRS